MSGYRVIAGSCVCALTHRPKLFPCCASQACVPGSQRLVSSASGMSVIPPQPHVQSFHNSPALLHGVSMICSRFRLSQFSSEGPQPSSSLWEPSSWPRVHPLTPQTPSSPSGLPRHQGLPLLHLYLCSPLGESRESRHGSALGEQEGAEHSREVSGEILTVSPLWHSGDLEKVMELEGEGRMKSVVWNMKLKIEGAEFLGAPEGVSSLTKHWFRLRSRDFSEATPTLHHVETKFSPERPISLKPGVLPLL